MRNHRAKWPSHGKFLGRLCAAVSLATAATFAHGDVECTLAAPDSSEVLLRSGERVTLPVHLAACDGVRVTRGKVVACVQDRRDRLDCQTFGSGTTIVLRATPATADGRGWLGSLIGLLQGDIGAASGVTRGAVEGALPIGPVALIAGNIVLDFTDGALKAADRVEFADAVTGAVVLKVSGGGKHLLDVAVFEPGRSYQWTVMSKSGDSAITGRFSVIDAVELGNVRRQKDALDSLTSADASARSLMLASWLQRNGLAFDAIDTLQRGGFLR